MNPENEKLLLNTSEAALLTGIPEQTLKKMRGKDGSIPYIKQGASVYYQRADIIDWINQQKIYPKQ